MAQVTQTSSSGLKSEIFRYANVSMGLCWSHRFDANTAQLQTSFAVSSFLLYIGAVPSALIEAMISEGISVAYQIYYNSSGERREPPILGAALKFKET